MATLGATAKPVLPRSAFVPAPTSVVAGASGGTTLGGGCGRPGSVDMSGGESGRIITAGCALPDRGARSEAVPHRSEEAVK